MHGPAGRCPRPPRGPRVHRQPRNQTHEQRIQSGGRELTLQHLTRSVSAGRGNMSRGAGRTRTHGRRIMSPLRILATLADQCSSLTFSLVRRGEHDRSFSALVSLFLSLCPERVLNACRRDRLSRCEVDRASSGTVSNPPAAAPPCPHRSIAALTSQACSRSHGCGNRHRIRSRQREPAAVRELSGDVSRGRSPREAALPHVAQ